MAKPHGELLPEVQDKLNELQKRYHQEKLFRALVDMYRNVHWEPEVAAYWMAEHDLGQAEDGSFSPITAGYDDAELKFLTARGVPML